MGWQTLIYPTAETYILEPYLGRVSIACTTPSKMNHLNVCICITSGTEVLDLVSNSKTSMQGRDELTLRPTGKPSLLVWRSGSGPRSVADKKSFNPASDDR